MVACTTKIVAPRFPGSAPALLNRFGRRRPFLSAVGRLDKETSGLLIMTDDGQLLHRIKSPSKRARGGVRANRCSGACGGL